MLFQQKMAQLSREDVWQRVLDDLGRLAYEKCDYSDKKKLQKLHTKLAVAWSAEADDKEVYYQVVARGWAEVEQYGFMTTERGLKKKRATHLEVVDIAALTTDNDPRVTKSS